MKVETLVMIILAVALIFALVGAVTDDFALHYDDEIDTEFQTKYNYANEINNSFAGTQKRIEAMGEEGAGGWKVFFNTLFVIPTAVIDFMKLILNSVVYIPKMIFGIASGTNIPNPIVNIVVPVLFIMIIASVIVSLIKFWHKPSPGV